MNTQQNLVILGASWAGISCAHYILKHVIPAIKTDLFHVYLVGPDANFYFNVASPRAVASPKDMPNANIFLNIADGFRQYGSTNFTFVQGLATSVDMSTRNVTIKRTDSGEDQVLSYHALVITTGIRAISPIYSLSPTSKETQEALETTNRRLANAECILIAGGGPTGVETAGEIAEALRKQSGSRKATVLLYSGGKRLLPALRPALGSKAESYLKDLGVDVVHGKRVRSFTQNSNGSTTLYLDGGESKIVDVYIPCTGVSPNTSYLPPSLLNEKGYVRNNPKTLRVDEASPRVYALGDVATHSNGGIFEAQSATVIAMSNLKRDLILAASAPNEQGQEPVAKAPPPGVSAIGAGEDKFFSKNEKETQLVTIGSSKGVGAFFGFAMPSFFIAKVKGKDYTASTAPAVVNGSRFTKEGRFAFWVR